MTVLRRLGRPLLCHFALGRNKNLQGLAASMIKLWEKCEIAKVAVKGGLQNMNSQLMAEELKAVYLFEVHCCSGSLVGLFCQEIENLLCSIEGRIFSLLQYLLQ